MLRSRRFWIGVAVSALFLYLFFRNLRLNEIGEAFASANYWLIGPAVAIYFVSVLFRALRWRFVLSPIGRFSTLRLFPVVVVGYMANNLLPVRLGELVRAYYVSQREKVSGSSSLATIIIERVYDGLTLLLFLALAAAFLPLAGIVDGLGERSGVPWLLLLGAVGGAFVGAIVILTVLATFPRLHGLVLWLPRLLPSRLRPRAAQIISLFLEGLAILKSPRRQVGVLLLSVPVWVCEGAMYLVVSLGFGLQQSLGSFGLLVGAMLLATAVANLAVSLPSSQGGVGPFEFFAASSLVLVGVAEGTAKAYALVLHLALLAPVTLAGLVILWWENLSLTQLARVGGTREPPGYGAADVPLKQVPKGEKP